MNAFTDFLLSVWNYTGVKFIVCHVAINVIVAVAAALHTKTFDFKKLLDFLTQKLAPYVLAFYAAKLLGIAGGIEWLAAPVWVLIETVLSTDLLGSLKQLDVPLPGFLASNVS